MTHTDVQIIILSIAIILTNVSIVLLSRMVTAKRDAEPDYRLEFFRNGLTPSSIITIPRDVVKWSDLPALMDQIDKSEHP